MSRFARPACLIFLAVLLVLAAANRHFIFQEPFHEEGDFAVNALQIDQAKRFHEIHGNYSRFNFDHPGPAFFYVYALGEAALYDAVRLTASPAAAHALAGFALQAGFFALALGIMAQWVRAPLFLPLALLVAAIHFRLAGGAFTSFWPPHVLAIPFLAFFVACASVAAGRGQDLPWAVLAGGFLVHGHVAQPLFVAVIFPAAYIFLCLAGPRAGRRAPFRAYPRAHAISAAILAVFLLPLLLDLTLGSQSNFAALVRHMRYNEGAPKSLRDSLLYFLSFFSYRHDQDKLFGSGAGARLGFLRERAVLYLFWAAALGLIAAAAAGRIGRASDAVRRFAGIMLLFWVLAAGLCLEWGRLQTGPMFDFNGHFYYGLIYALALIGCALLAESAVGTALPKGLSQVEARGVRGHALTSAATRLWAAGLCAAAIAVTGLRLDRTDEMINRLDLRDGAMRALRADPSPDAPKLLVFAHDDWGTAASVALALERAGKSARVDPSWAFMFQRAHTEPSSRLVDATAHLSVWRFVPRRSRARESVACAVGRDASCPAIALDDSLAIDFRIAPLSPIHGLIDFSQSGNLYPYLLCGVVTPDSDSTWTDLTDAALQFHPLPASGDVPLALAANPFLDGRRLPSQTVEVRFNGVLLARTILTGPAVVRAVVPRDLWNRSPTAVLDFYLPNARSPAELGLSGDPRQLGLSVTRLTTGP